ncbi:MAG TPA: hypothetical protein VGQ09_03300 [Chitinophagaceae bacterium]|jgi:hypothetical protein|nr:hypothetical protein [Chitinophagaceae bacterium]
MKKNLLFISIVCITICANAQFQAGFNYSMAIPLKEMGKNINLTHSAVVDFRYQFKKTAKNFWLGTQLGAGVYAIKTQRQLYQFSNGSTTEADVRFTSNIINAHLIAGTDLVQSKPITPYVVAKGGLSGFYTGVYIPDPDDQGSCKPLENKNIYKDETWSAGVGAGVKIAGSKIFKKVHSDDWWIDLSANYLTGGTVNYLNVKHLMEHNDDTNFDPKGFNVSFVNVSTNEVHQHQVAEVYTSRINQLDIKLGILVRL